MREVAVVYAYFYSELSEEAKENVKGLYLNECYNPCDHIKNDLDYIFPNSNLNVQCDYNYYQCNDVNICGSLELEDLLSIFTDKEYCGTTFKKFWDCLSSKEICRLREIGSSITIPENDGWYSYCMSHKIDILCDWSDGEDSITEYPVSSELFDDDDIKLIRKLNIIAIELFTCLCSGYEKDITKFLQDFDDDDMEEVCDINGWEFLENGDLFYKEKW